jgi:phage gp45-like
MNVILNKMRNLIKFAKVTLSGSDSGGYNQSQVNYFGKTKQTFVLFPYGLDAKLPADSIVVLFNIMGQEENTVGIGTKPSIRFKNLQEGEVVVGNPSKQTKIYFKNDGTIEITGDTNVIINNGTKGVARLDDTTISNSSTDSTYWNWPAGLKTYIDSHVHTGVTTGPGASGPPSAPSPTAPTSLTSKINSASGTVKAGD